MPGAPALKKSGESSRDIVIDALVNQQTMERLKIQAGDQFQVRIAKPSLLPRDVPLAVEGKADEMVVTVKLRLVGMLEADSLGDFSLRPDPLPPLNIFIPLEPLQELAHIRAGKAQDAAFGGAGDRLDGGGSKYLSIKNDEKKGGSGGRSPPGT